MLTRISAVVFKEFGHILADYQTLSLLLLIPALELLLFGYAINTVVDHVAMVVFDDAHVSDSRMLVASLQNSGYFELKESVSSYDAAAAAIHDGRARVALIIPNDFASAVLRGDGGTVQLLVDGSDPNTAQAALFAADSIVGVHANQLTAAALQRLGQPAPPGGVEMRPVVLFNPSMLSATFVVPGLIGVILQQETLILTAQAIVRERELGTLEQLTVTPVRAWELMVGKCIPYLVIALATVAITLGIARVVFGIAVAGNVVLLFALSLLFLVGALGTGLFVSAIARSEMEARQLADLFLLPAILLTGFIFPRESMPGPAQAVGFLLPLTYFLQILRGIILKGVGIEVLWPELVPLAVYAAVALAASAYLFRKRAA